MKEPDHSLRDIFAEALELIDAQQRSDFLAQACGGDPAMLREVEELLKAEAAAGPFLPDHPADKSRTSLQGLADAVSALSSGPLSEMPGDRIGRYELLEKIGEGGCGAVYRAQQEAPVRRQVALKVIKLGMDTRQVIARFEAERQTLALMEHPNIAKVFDAGATDTGRPYFVMELVRGVKITDYCNEQELSTRARLELFIQVCLAVQHAHQKGIIHRDLKPSNILVTVGDAVAVPKVIDFGIAKATEGKLADQTLFTAFEQLLGTPAYMSPEQAAMTGDIDTRSDIYSLGVLLYELLVGRTPFDTKELLALGVDDLRRTIREKEPKRPSTRLTQEVATAGVRSLKCKSAQNGFSEEEAAAFSPRLIETKELIHQLRGDLDWIVMKCLEKDRTRRYETASGLAADLRRHLNHEPVLARPPSRLYEFQKTVRRHKVGFTAAAAVMVALVAGVMTSTWQAVRATRAEREQTRLRLHAEAQAYTSDMNVAKQAWDEGNLLRAQELLMAHIPNPSEPDLRGFEWRLLWNLCRDESLSTHQVVNDVVKQLVTTPAHSFVAACCEKSVRLLDPVTGREIQRLEYLNPAAGNPFPVIALTYGTTNILAAHRAEGWVTIWDLSGRERLISFRAFTNNVGRLALSPDGRFLAAANRVLLYSTAICLWDISSRSQAPRLVWSKPTTDALGALAFSPDGEFLVAAGSSQTEVRISVLNLETGGELEPIPDASAGMINAIAFSPDGALLAASGNDSRIHVWSFASRTLKTFFDGHAGSVTSLSFSPDGRKLISGSSDGTIRLWDMASDAAGGTWRDRPRGSSYVAFAPDGKSIISATGDSVKLWKPEPREPATIIETRKGWGLRPIISPDGKWMITSAATNDPGSRFAAAWELKSGQQKFVLPFRGTTPHGMAFSPDGRYFALGDLEKEGLVALWECRAWEGTKSDLNPVAYLTNGFEAGSLAFSFDGKTLAVAGLSFPPFDPVEPSTATNRLAFWEVGSWKKLDLLPQAGLGHTEWAAAGTVAFSLDGRWLATGHRDGWVRLWNFKKKQLLKLFKLHDTGGWSADVRFSADNHWLASYVISGSKVVLFDLTDLERPPVILIRDEPSGVFALEFAPDNRTLVTGHINGELRFWNLKSLAVALTLKNGHGPGGFPAFSPDGNLLISKTAQGTVRLWHAAPSSEIPKLNNQESERRSK